APVNAGDTATFNTSTITTLFLSDDVTIDSMTFNSGADAFTIITDSKGPFSFSFVGAGIVNNSTQTQTIVNSFGGSTNFLNSSSAGNATIINSSFLGNAGFLGNPGVTNFNNTSTAGNATITNELGGTTNFLNS